jgi:hypothetical protein
MTGMKTTVLALASVVVFGAASSANAQIDLGASAGWYIPVSSDVRDAFGNAIFHFGIGSVGRVTTGNLKIGTNLDFITANRNGNRLLIVPLTLEVEQALTMDAHATTKPYIKGFIGGAYMDYGITQAGIRTEDKVLRMTLGAEFGVVISDRLRLSARYNAFPKTGGFDFSGITLSATVQVLK